MKIEIGKTYKGKYSGVLVIAKSEQDADGWFFGAFKTVEEVLATEKIVFHSDAFELYEPKPSIPTLYEVVIKYQSLGFNIDFDTRGHSNICYVGLNADKRGYGNYSNIKYNKSESEKDLVRGILWMLAKWNTEARDMYNLIK